MDKGMDIEEAKAQLQAAISAPGGKYWSYTPAVSSLISALEQAQQEYQAIEQKLISAALYIETLESEPRKTNLKLLNEITGLKRKCVEMPDSFAKIGENLRTQDNRITDQPMFVVFEKREIIGSDEHSPSRIVWCWEGEEVSELRAKRLEALYQDCRDTRGYDRYAMQEIDAFVTACFTEQGCRDYLIRNGHNLRLPYIFASGSYRNSEYQQVRSWLMTIGTVEGSE